MRSNSVTPRLSLSSPTPMPIHSLLPNLLSSHPVPIHRLPLIESPALNTSASPSTATHESPALPQTTHFHPMVTRSKLNISKPTLLPDGNLKYPLPQALLSTTDMNEIEPTCYSTTIKHPQWRKVMNTGFGALLKNHTWKLVPFDYAINVIGCK